jgi:hypothetical protein
MSTTLPKKYKEYMLTHYYRGIEVLLRCTTTSIKKFTEITGIRGIKAYVSSFEPKTQECIDNPEILYAEIGMSGEGLYVFERDKLFLFSEYKIMIDKHRETYSNYRDYLDKTNQP